MTGFLESFLPTALFVYVFLFPRQWRVFKKRQKNYRKVISFASGISVAYIFVHLIPELSHASHVTSEYSSDNTQEISRLLVYYLTLLGFMIFYGLEHLISWSNVIPESSGRKFSIHKVAFLIHMLSLSAYVALVCYSITYNTERTTTALVLYTFAMTAHFVSLRHGLEYEYEKDYRSLGKYLLAISCVAGWIFALLYSVHEIVIVCFLGLIAGSVIMNTMTSELPEKKKGSFYFFLIGGIFYAAILFFL